MPNIPNRIAENQKHWEVMRFNSPRLGEIEAVCVALIKHKDQYVEITQGVEELTGLKLSWGIPAVIDQREHAPSFGLCNSYLGNGQSLLRKTTIKPTGRGPFFDHPDTDKPLRGGFFRGAMDALVDVQQVQDWKDWSQAGALTFLESLNGFGYANGPGGRPPMLSPYIFGATTEQQRGKYVADSKFDPSEWDQQIGCAALLRYMSGLDPSVGFALAPPPPPDEEFTVKMTIEIPEGVKVTVNGKELT